MMVIRQDSVPDVIANKCGQFIDTHVRYRTISDSLQEKIEIFTDNYLDNQRFLQQQNAGFSLFFQYFQGIRNPYDSLELHFIMEVHI